MSRVHKSLLHTCHVYPGTHVMKLLILSGKFSDCPEIFNTVRKLSRLSGNFSHPLETFHTAENFPDCRETFQTVWYILKLIISYVDVQALFYFMVNFARRRKKPSSRQCRHVDEVFGTLETSLCRFLHILHIVASARNILRMKA